MTNLPWLYPISDTRAHCTNTMAIKQTSHLQRLFGFVKQSKTESEQKYIPLHYSNRDTRVRVGGRGKGKRRRDEEREGGEERGRRGQEKGTKRERGEGKKKMGKGEGKGRGWGKRR